MSKVFFKNLEKAISETENMVNEEDIIKYCAKKLTKNSTDRACHRWERIRDVLLERLSKKQECKFKIGDKVHWIKSDGKVDTQRTDKIINITFDIWNNIRIRTVEISGDKKMPKRGLAYPEYLVLAN